MEEAPGAGFKSEYGRCPAPRPPSRPGSGAASAGRDPPRPVGGRKGRHVLSARQINRACQKRREEARSHSPQPVPTQPIPAGPGAEAAGTDRYVRAPLLPSGSSTVRARRRDLVRRLSCSMALSILGAASPEPRTPPAAAARPQPIAALAAPRPHHPGRLRACAGRGGGRLPQCRRRERGVGDRFAQLVESGALNVCLLQIKIKKSCLLKPPLRVRFSGVTEANGAAKASERDRIDQVGKKKPSEIIDTNLGPNTSMSTRPWHQGPHTVFF